MAGTGTGQWSAVRHGCKDLYVPSPAFYDAPNRSFARVTLRGPLGIFTYDNPRYSKGEVHGPQSHSHAGRRVKTGLFDHLLESPNYVRLPISQPDERKHR